MFLPVDALPKKTNGGFDLESVIDVEIVQFQDIAQV